MTRMTAADSAQWFEKEFSGTHVMLILRGLGAERSLELARTAWGAGVRTLELPVHSDADLEALQVVAAEATQRGLRVGVRAASSIRRRWLLSARRAPRTP